MCCSQWYNYSWNRPEVSNLNANSVFNTGWLHELHDHFLRTVILTECCTSIATLLVLGQLFLNKAHSIILSFFLSVDLGSPIWGPNLLCCPVFPNLFQLFASKFFQLFSFEIFLLCFGCYSAQFLFFDNLSYLFYVSFCLFSSFSLPFF